MPPMVTAALLVWHWLYTIHVGLEIWKSYLVTIKGYKSENQNMADTITKGSQTVYYTWNKMVYII